MSAPHAVVDLGTHSCLLLVARRGADGGLDVLADLCEVPRFGAGLDRTGCISEEALQRVGGILDDYLGQARALGCERLVVGGTAALRRAKNQADVIARLTKAGIELDVLSEEREAYLGWCAVSGGDLGISIIDVGGGSTEVVARGGELLRSAPVGAVVLTERLGDRSWAALYEEARGAIAGLATGGGVPVVTTWVALGGTPSNLAALELGLERFDHRVVEGAELPAEATIRWGTRLAGMSLAERLELPIEATRAEVLPAGLACLGATLAAFGVESFRVSGRGVRFGMMEAALGA